MKKRLINWEGLSPDVTLGDIYHINEKGLFSDDRGDYRDSCYGDWKEVVMGDKPHDMSKGFSLCEQQQWSMDDFNEQLKELLRRAGQNGIAVNRIEASYMDAGTMGSGKNFVLRDVDVEYRM